MLFENENKKMKKFAEERPLETVGQKWYSLHEHVKWFLI